MIVMKQRKLFIYILPVLILIITVTGCLAVIGLSKDPAPAEPVLKAPPLVEVAAIELKDISVPLILSGTVSSTENTVMAAEVSGTITEISPKMVKGGFFKKGEKMFQTDDADYRAALAQAEAELAKVKLSATREQELFRQAEKDWKALGEGIPTNLALRKPHLAMANAELLAATAALEKARRDLSRTATYAPYDCMISERSVSKGTWVSPGTKIAELFNVDMAEIRIAVTASDAAFIDIPRPGEQNVNNVPVCISWNDNGQTRKRTGYLSRTEGTVDPETRVQHLVVRVDDPYGLKKTHPHLMTGTFADVSIPGKTMEKSVSLPSHSISNDQKVKIVEKGNIVLFKKVKVLRRIGDMVIVTGNFSAGDMVIVTPMDYAAEGMQVRIADHKLPYGTNQKEI